jgi:hypothetical protein
MAAKKPNYKYTKYLNKANEYLNYNTKDDDDDKKEEISTNKTYTGKFSGYLNKANEYLSYKPKESKEEKKYDYTSSIPMSYQEQVARGVDDKPKQYQFDGKFEKQPSLVENRPSMLDSVNKDRQDIFNSTPVEYQKQVYDKARKEQEQQFATQMVMDMDRAKYQDVINKAKEPYKNIPNKMSALEKLGTAVKNLPTDKLLRPKEEGLKAFDADVLGALTMEDKKTKTMGYLKPDPRFEWDIKKPIEIVGESKDNYYYRETDPVTGKTKTGQALKSQVGLDPFTLEDTEKYKSYVQGKIGEATEQQEQERLKFRDLSLGGIPYTNKPAQWLDRIGSVGVKTMGLDPMSGTASYKQSIPKLRLRIFNTFFLLSAEI